MRTGCLVSLVAGLGLVCGLFRRRRLWPRLLRRRLRFLRRHRPRLPRRHLARLRWSRKLSGLSPVRPLILLGRVTRQRRVFLPRRMLRKHRRKWPRRLQASWVARWALPVLALARLVLRHRLVVILRVIRVPLWVRPRRTWITLNRRFRRAFSLRLA